MLWTVTRNNTALKKAFKKTSIALFHCGRYFMTLTFLKKWDILKVSNRGLFSTSVKVILITMVPQVYEHPLTISLHLRPDLLCFTFVILDSLPMTSRALGKDSFQMQGTSNFDGRTQSLSTCNKQLKWCHQRLAAALTRVQMCNFGLSFFLS